MPHDLSTSCRITNPVDDRKDIQKLPASTEFRKAKYWFWPVVFGFTMVFGVFDGIKGAFVGFLYGVAAGLFLLHESLRGDKK
jgi:hypothetical protein